MRFSLKACLPLGLLLVLPGLAAPPKVVFSRQVLPLLNRECLSCHRGSAAPGGFSMESQERMFSGGRHGAAIAPGKSGDSTLLKYLTGELKPQMPPNKPLSLDTIALVRRWIDEGGKVDSMVAPVERGGVLRDAMPMSPRMPTAAPHGAPVPGSSPLLPMAAVQSAPVTALAYSPDGKLLAAGGYLAVRLLDPATGSVVHTLPGPVDQVTSLAWSSDGKRLAAAGGLSGSFGEVCVWDAPSPPNAWGKPRVLKDHTDSITCVAWRPGTSELATTSTDKTVRIWDASAGKVTQVLKDHVDAVFGVAYSADGKWMATCSADRTAKLYELPARTKVSSFNHADAVTAVTFNPKSDLLLTACLDKQVRVWPAKAGTVENPLRNRGEGEPINSLTYSADGSLCVWGASNRMVRVWNDNVENRQREFRGAPDWVYAVAASPDGKQVAGGAGDGKVYFWQASDGKLERSVPLGPAAVVASAAAEVKK